MKYKIKFTPNALKHLQGFNKYKQKIILDATIKQLSFEPLKEIRNRKPLRKNPLSRWELRVQEFRIFYDVDSQVVEIKAIGQKKNTRLYINGKEFLL